VSSFLNFDGHAVEKEDFPGSRGLTGRDHRRRPAEGTAQVLIRLGAIRRNVLLLERAGSAGAAGMLCRSHGV